MSISTILEPWIGSITDSNTTRTTSLTLTLILVTLLLPVLLYAIRNGDGDGGGDGIYQNFATVRGQPWYTWVWPLPVHEVVDRGYQQITKKTDQPFVVRWWARNYLIMPPKYLAELRNAPWRHLSFFTNISDALYLHTTVGNMYQSDRMVNVVKKGLNPQLPRLTTEILVGEVDRAMERELGTGKEWRSVAVTRSMIAVSHRATSRVMVCEEMARDEELVEAAGSFVESIFVNALIIVKLPLGPFRELLAYPLSFLHRRKLEKATKMLQPIVERRIAEAQSASPKSYDDAIEWTLAVSGPEDDISPRYVTQELLHGLWAGTSAPGGLVGDLVFQSLMMPECLSALREEAQAVISEHGWSESAFGKLRLQDSFIREVNRMYPIGSVTCSRTVKDKEYRFSDGFTLSANTRFGFPIKAMQGDVDLLGESADFDAFRFARKEETQTQDRHWAATTVDSTNLAFGYGNHVCPGRFYAIRKVKLIFTKLLLNYEFRWDGAVKERPKPILVEGQFIPNMSARVMLRHL